jgi:hypothetical protein
MTREQVAMAIWSLRVSTVAKLERSEGGAE